LIKTKTKLAIDYFICHNKIMTMINQMDNVLNGLKIKGKCVNAKAHRHLAFYDIALEPGVKFSKLRNSMTEISLGLRSETEPVFKVIPKEGVVRVQVAMKPAEKINLHSILFQSAPPVKMTFPMLLGETGEGNPLWCDMAKNPHLLVAGTTGSGKSVLLHTIIANCMVMTAYRVRYANLHLVDPKRTEFISYKDAPCVESFCTSYEDAVTLLQSMVDLMEIRYTIMQKIGIRGIEESPNLFPQEFIVIDEVADLLMQDRRKGKLEELIIRLAQKARAAGIYLVLATQRPSKDVFPPTLKANFGRIACRTASTVDSQVVLDMPGAEKLLGRGDAILRNMEHDQVRFQAAYTEPKIAINMYKHIRNRTAN
jgi:S-DNA-T family DNA segregation ATPase FtsK/SpoIIIE